MSPHWYAVWTYYCPVCLSERHCRQRMYTRRPKRYNLRHWIIESYDNCLEWEGLG